MVDLFFLDFSSIWVTCLLIISFCPIDKLLFTRPLIEDNESMGISYNLEIENKVSPFFIIWYSCALESILFKKIRKKLNLFLITLSS